MGVILVIPKFTIVVTTRCNLRCKLCCEYVPQNKSFSDITINECERLLLALFNTVDHVNTLHLSGGGEPFLHSKLADLVEACMKYQDKFDKLMLFTNCTIIPSQELVDVLAKHKEKIVLQVSRYGIDSGQEAEVLSKLKCAGTKLKIEKYYGEDQTFGGWVDFGAWKSQNRTSDELVCVFKNCAVTRDMHGNWRTRDGKVHWCSRSQRGTELELIPHFKEDYVDLFDETSVQEKRKKFFKLMSAKYINACNYCSGHQGTTDNSLRFQAAEQVR